MEEKNYRKLRGGYYTPKAIADFISTWAIRNNEDSLLEPSFGDGIFLQSSLCRFRDIGTSADMIPILFHGVESDEGEAEKAIKILRTLGVKHHLKYLTTGDFFTYCKENLIGKMNFDCVLGNPPFIRYQDFPETQRIAAFSLMIRAGLKPNRLTNTWIPFLVASSLLLKKHGRLGMVIPAELFQVNYASETRRFLSESFGRLTIITFRKLVFPEIQQEVVLVLGEKGGNSGNNIRVIELTDVDELANLHLDDIKNSTVQLDHSTDKWTQYYLNKKEIELLRSIRSNPAVPLSGEYFKVDVGIVTGQNKFFLLNRTQVKQLGLERHVVKIVGKANQVKGIILKDDDWTTLSDSQNPVYLLNAPDVNYESLPEKIKGYLNYGDSHGFNSGFKCRMRKRWWVVPSTWVPDAFMLRQIHAFPKVALNKCSATATDTLHRIKFINGLRDEMLASSFINSLTFAFSEITGRSYGGGVLTFEPSEAERLPLPTKNADQLDAKEIDRNLRSNQIERILNENDAVLLKKGLALSTKDIALLRGVWKKLRDRRINRKLSSINR